MNLLTVFWRSLRSWIVDYYAWRCRMPLFNGLLLILPPHTPVIIGDPSPAVRLAHSRYPATQRVSKCPCQRTAERNKRLALIQSTPSFSCVPRAVPSPRRRSHGFQVRSPLFRPGDYGWLVFEWCSVTKSFFHRTVAEWMRRMPLQMCETSLFAFDWREAARRPVPSRPEAPVWERVALSDLKMVWMPHFPSCSVRLHYTEIHLRALHQWYMCEAEPRRFWKQSKALMF